MVETVLAAVFVVLVLNLVAALVICARRRRAGSWLLVILLAGTSGAALAGILAVTAEDGERYFDVALVLTGTAAVTAAVRAALPNARGRDAVEHAAAGSWPSAQDGPS
ncbi:hypothetical protein [Nesterenkonia sp. NBAIMH1]|uniref:hypothetical protein n=1 Tax=Nesterenkonia sp. NBAIMH1 TaxID=2600320 RepID=UPI0011B80DFB|nr:hypothetical protein [Nesterenkonia sp. NBAIMH1]